MDTSDLLQWHYLIYLLPLGVAALFLVLSTVRFGSHSGAHSRQVTGHAPAHGHTHSGGHQGTQGHGQSHAHGASAHAKAPAPIAKSGGHPKAQHTAKANKVQSLHRFSLFSDLFGIGRAPLPILIEVFCITWGFFGFWANQLLIKHPDPTLMQMLPSLGSALAGGWLSTRVFAELFARIAPKDESYDVSHEQLFGLTGKVTFAVSESTGRIHIYDENGSLHDEPCLIAEGHPPIARGQRAMVVDMDAKGRLIVEEIPEGAVQVR